jgi:hypothetical protein
VVNSTREEERPVMTMEEKLYADINKLVTDYIAEKLRLEESINVPDINRAIVDVVMEQDSDKHGDLIAAAINSIGAYYLERRGLINPAPARH